MASGAGMGGAFGEGFEARTRPQPSGNADSLLPTGRVPPSHIEAEKAVLAAILLDNDALMAVLESIRTEDFYHPSHQIIFESMVALNAQSKPVDLISLHDHLKNADRLEMIGGVVFLGELSDSETTAAHAEHYAKIVRDKSIKRSLIRVATEIVTRGYEDSDPSDELLGEAEAKVFELGQTRATATLRPLNDEMHETTDFLEVLASRSGELTGLPTGFSELDKITGGFQPGDLVILAARPSMGKTALALNIARNAAVDYHKKVAVFSLEMTARSLVLRMLAAEARVDASGFRSGFMPPHVFTSLIDAAGRLADESIWIDDSSVASVLEMRAKARRLHQRERLDLIIVDYLQLARGDGRIDSREQEISSISRGLKGLAKELNVPVVALSQLNRGPESRGAEDKRPMLSDLRESGAIEQDADVIGFIYRDAVYNRDTEFEDLAELIISKQRNGPTGTVKMQWSSRFAQFTDWTGDDPYKGGPSIGYADAASDSSLDPEF